MINLYDLGQVYIVCGRTDIRRGIDGLAAKRKWRKLALGQFVKSRWRLSRLRYLKHRWLTVTAQLQSLLTLSIKSINWKYQPIVKRTTGKKWGLSVTRQDIINWQTKSTEYYFEPLYQLLKEKLLEQKFLHADETAYRILESETVKTLYWTFLSDKQAKKPITLYHHDPHRSGQLAQATFLTDKASAGKLQINFEYN